MNFLEQLSQTIADEQGTEADTSEPVNENAALMNQLAQISRIENSSVIAFIGNAR